MPYITTGDGCKLYYQTMGLLSNKPVIVFLNGTLQNHLNWKSLARLFEDKYRVLIYDARTQGQSETGNKKLSLDLHISDLMNLLDHLRVKNVNLVGQSHGARVALSFAMKNPRMMNRLILCGIGHTLTKKTRLIIESWQRILTKGGLEAMVWASIPWVFADKYIQQNYDIVDKMVSAIIKRNRKEAIAKHLEALLNYAPLNQEPIQIECPTLVISGSDDPMAEPEQGKVLADLCHGHHKIFTNVGHTIPAEAPKRFRQELKNFL